MAYDAAKAAERWRKDWAFMDACLAGEGPDGCMDCSRTWDIDLPVAQDGYDDYGLWLCDRCAEKRLECDYLNSAESRADRAYDAAREP